jgi:hypothetical protein
VLGIRGRAGQCRSRRARGEARHGAGRRAGGGRTGALVVVVSLEALRRGGAGVGVLLVVACSIREGDGGALVVAHGLRQQGPTRVQVRRGHGDGGAGCSCRGAKAQAAGAALGETQRQGLHEQGGEMRHGGEGGSTSRRRYGPRVACRIFRGAEAWGLASKDEAAHRVGTHP